MIYITSDIHLNHQNIIKYSNRPFSSVEEMNESAITTINQIVKHNDQLFFLGDFVFPYKNFDDSLIPFWKKINCQNINWILGNHDPHIDIVRANRLMDLHHLKTPFEFISHYYELKYNKEKIVMSHYPILEWNWKRKNGIHFHGHCHSASPVMPGTRSCEVGYDSTGKWVLSIDEAISLADTNFNSPRKEECVTL